MTAAPPSLLQRALAHDPNSLAFSSFEGPTVTFGEVTARAVDLATALAARGISPGDPIATILGAGGDLMALVLAASARGARLTVLNPSSLDRLGATQQGGYDLIIGGAASHRSGIRAVPLADLSQVSSRPVAADDPAAAVLITMLRGQPSELSADTVVRSIDNLCAALPFVPGQILLAGSSPDTPGGLFISVVAPLAIGLHIILAPDDPAFLERALVRADHCELPAAAWTRRHHLPARVQSLLCGSGHLDPASAAHAATILRRPVRVGFGTADTGLWAVTTGDRRDRYRAEIRPLRSPLHLRDAPAGALTGEILLRPRDKPDESRCTAAVGWLGAEGGLAVAGALADVVVRTGIAHLLTELDRTLCDHPEMRESRSFRARGASPTEKSVSVCLTEADPATLTAWLADRIPPGTAPDRLVTIAPDHCRALPSTEILRRVVDGTAARAVVAALTARRFRRNPPYDEAALATAIDTAVLSGCPLDFLMFWGCGPRRTAAAPDRAAIEALGELLAAAEAAAPLRARAHIVCTDLHAINNGHAESHYTDYFASIRALAAPLDVGFELESDVWRRNGLTKARILALEQQPEFQRRWAGFALRDRFIQQASRHSGMADKEAAARHYFATCLLEREILKETFADSVFLTYNGPDFNECFPDLPTLYVYPGPRGRNDKPWFVPIDERIAAE